MSEGSSDAARRREVSGESGSAPPSTTERSNVTGGGSGKGWGAGDFSLQPPSAGGTATSGDANQGHQWPSIPKSTESTPSERVSALGGMSKRANPHQRGSGGDLELVAAAGGEGSSGSAPAPAAGGAKVDGGKSETGGGATARRSGRFGADRPTLDPPLAMRRARRPASGAEGGGAAERSRKRAR